MSANGWSEGAWGDTGWGGLENVTVEPTLGAATSTLGSESVSGDAPLSVTGFGLTSSVGQVQGFQGARAFPAGFYNQVHIGSVVVSIPVDVSVTGVEGTVESLTGWGKGTWGEFVYGGGVFADVGQVETPNLPAINSFLGSSSITGTAVVFPTGVSGSTLLESVLVGAGAIVGEDGMVGSVGLGDESVVGTCNLTLTGVSGATALGDEGIETDTGAPVTNVPGMTSALGDETVTISVTPTITGFGATSALGSVSVTGTSVLTLTGTEGSGNISSVIVWGRIVPSQNANWNEVAA